MSDTKPLEEVVIAKEEEVNVDDKILKRSLGVWTLLVEKPSFRFDLLKDISASVLSLRKLAQDIYSLGPTLLIIYLLSKAWDACEPVLLLHFSSQLLQLIEIGIREGKPDVAAIGYALLTRLICITIASAITWKKDCYVPILENRADMFYQEYLLSATLKTDLPTSKEGKASTSNAQSSSAWRAFEELLDYISLLVSTFAQIGFMLQATSHHGPLFTILCISKPLIRTLGSTYLWMKPYIVYSNNEAYKRMQALHTMSSTEYRKEIIGGNLGDYILTEYSRARKTLQETSTEGSSYGDLFMEKASPYFETLVSIAGDLPMVYYAANAIFNPTNFSLTSIALLQQSSMLMQQTIQSIFWQTQSVTRTFTDLKKLYNASNITNELVDGGILYQSGVVEADEKRAVVSKGMRFDLRNVTFSYPGTKMITPAIKDLTLSIKPGELVVIVGGNGSGKSTLVNLLTRMYDATSGQVLVDSRSIKDYSMSSLRRATALLCQDHHIFPLSIYENIALGCPDSFSDRALVEESIRKGGANFIEKFETGLDTVLEPVQLAHGCNIYGEDDPVRMALRKKLKEVEKSADVSGGEKQRIVAARTFMRFNSGQIRFVAVDEPSSALDAEGELQLFNNLIEAREGKTMIFVTHRFGHLTKFADTIMFMKDGNVAEKGTHNELMTLDGEYAKFYSVQAIAFTKA